MQPLPRLLLAVLFALTLPEAMVTSATVKVRVAHLASAGIIGTAVALVGVPPAALRFYTVKSRVWGRFWPEVMADDLSAATRRGYRYDLLHFIAWYTGLYDAMPELTRLTEHDLITWWQHMMMPGGLKAASININRRLEAVRRLLRWAEANGTVARNVAVHVKSVRIVRKPRPLGLTAARCMAYCALRARVLTGLRGAITPWSSSCFKPACGSVRCRHCGGKTLCFANAPAQFEYGMARV